MSNAEVIRIPDFDEPFQIVELANASGCVDPRTPTEIASTIDTLRREPLPSHRAAQDARYPGATVGMTMTLMGAVPEITPEEALNVTVAFETREKRLVTTHGDMHAGNMGCGHVARATHKDNAVRYDLPHNKVQEVHGLLFERAKRGEFTIYAPVLQGNHRESGILVVSSDKQTVVPHNQTHELFRFDHTVHDARLKGLADVANKRGIAVSHHQLIETAQKQREATLSLLAAGLPIFAVDLKQGRRKVAHLGTVPHP